MHALCVMQQQAAAAAVATAAAEATAAAAEPLLLQRLLAVAAAVNSGSRRSCNAGCRDCCRLDLCDVYECLPSVSRQLLLIVVLLAAHVPGTLAGLAWTIWYAILPTTNMPALGVQTDKLLHHWGYKSSKQQWHPLPGGTSPGTGTTLRNGSKQPASGA